MRLLISKKAILQYILIYLMIIWHDAGLKWMIGKDTFDFICLIFSSFVWMISIKKRNKYIENFSALMLLNIIIVRTMNMGGIGISYFFHFLSAIMLLSVAFYVDRENFIDRYVKIVVIFAWASILLWLYTIFFPESFKSISWFSYVPYQKPVWSSSTEYTLSPVTYYGTFFYVARFGNDLMRNNGIFNEPGLYQMIVVVALTLLLFFRHKIKCSKRKYNFYVLTLIVTIITIQSTSGYINLVMILVTYLFFSKKVSKQTKNKLMLISVGVILFVIFDFSKHGYDSFLSKVIFDKINFDGGVKLIGTGSDRIETWKAVLMCLKENPFGVGFDRLFYYLGSIGKTTPDGAALIAVLGALGVEIYFIIFSCIFRPIYYNRYTVGCFFLIIFLFVNNTFGQSDIFYPSLLLFALPLNRKVRRSEYENSMDVQCENIQNK